MSTIEKFRLRFCIALATLIAVPSPAPAWSPWIEEPLDSEVEQDYRAPDVDIAPLGDGRFVLSYYDSDNWLRYRVFDADTDYATEPQPLTFSHSYGRNSWIRAMTGGPVQERPDPGQIYGGGPVPLYGMVNFFAVESNNDIFLMRHEYDDRFRVSSHLVAGTSGTTVFQQGGRPSVAWAEPPGLVFMDPGRALTVWGNQEALMGRFMDLDGDAIGDAFTIVDLDDDLGNYTLPFVFSTDVIWNPVSERFIVGLVARDNAQHCEFWNLRLTYDGALDDIAPPSLHGYCGHNVEAGGVDGHHTSVAYTPNAAGQYAWWYIDESPTGGVGTKGVRLMDAWGEPVLDGGDKVEWLQPLSTSNPYTDPVAGLPSSPWWTEPHYIFPWVTDEMQVRGLYAGSGNFTLEKTLSGVTSGVYPQMRAIAALDDTTSVVVWTACPNRDCVVPTGDVPGAPPTDYPSYMIVVEDGQPQVVFQL